MGLEGSVDNPLNREPPLRDLVSSFITEKDGYDRNHSAIPHINAQKHMVLVNGAVKRPLLLTIDQLRRRFRQHEVVCTLSCAGNRRHTMRTLIKEVQGIDWNDGAIMNCAWKGPKLKDILNKAGVDLTDWKTAHVEFACHQAVCQQDDWYGASLELERVMADDAEILLALEMNGHALPPQKGHPVRLIAPGIYGCRSVKWLDRITIQQHESQNFYQQRDYKILPPSAIDSATAAPYWSIVPAMTETAINSVIASPQSGETIPLSAAGTLAVSGYAVPQGDQGPIVRVEVSVEHESGGDESWVEAELLKAPLGVSGGGVKGAGEDAGGGGDDGGGKGGGDGADGNESKGEARNGKWCWTIWRVEIAVAKGAHISIFSRATDSGGNIQPRMTAWNLRGVGYNGYGRAVGVKVS